jgi:hypothetical protein
VTNEAQEQFIGEQVRALATVFLTRRGDLTIVDTKQDTGVDLHVYVNREDKPMRLTLGILLRGVVAPVTAAAANKLLGPTLGQFRGLRKFTYPVCLFLFTLRQEQAFFSWLAEPIMKDGAPKLVHRDQAECALLTNDLFERALDQVVAWYDAVEAVLIA